MIILLAVWMQFVDGRRSYANEVTMHYHLWCCTSCSVFFGTKPAYFIADMDLVREITVKHFDKFTDRLVREIMCTTPY